MKIKKTIYLFAGWYEVGKQFCYSLACNGFSFFLSVFELLQISALMACLRCERPSPHFQQRNRSASNRRLKLGGMR